MAVLQGALVQQRRFGLIWHTSGLCVAAIQSLGHTGQRLQCSSFTSSSVACTGIRWASATGLAMVQVHSGTLGVSAMGLTQVTSSAVKTALVLRAGAMIK